MKKFLSILVFLWFIINVFFTIKYQGENYYYYFFLTLKYIYVLFFIFILSYSCGYYIYKKTSKTINISAESILFSSILGTGILSIINLIIGFTGFLYSDFLASIYIVILLLHIKPLFNLFKFTINKKRHLSDFSFNIFNITFLIILLFLIIINSYLPSISMDTLEYHLGLPHKYLINHSIFTIPEYIYTYYPNFTETLYLTLGAFKQYKIFFPVMTIFILINLILVVRYFSYLIFRKKIENIIIFTMPFIFLLFVWHKNDLYLTLMAFTGLYFLFKSYKSIKIISKTNWKLFSLYFAFLPGIKYNSLYIIVSVFIVLIIQKIKFKKNKWYRNFIYSILLMFIISGFFYIKNLYLTKNPVYPYFNKKINKNQKIFFSGAKISKNSIFKKNKIKFFKDLFYGKEKLNIASTLGPLGILCIPFFLMVSFLYRNNPKINFIFLFVLIYFLFWISMLPNTRYFMLGILFIVIIGLYNFRFLIYKPVFNIIIVLIFLINIYLTFNVSFTNRYVFPLLTTNLNNEKYLSSVLYYYDAYNYANYTTPENSKFMILGNFPTYYLNRQVIDSSSFDRPFFNPYIQIFNNIDDLYDNIKKHLNISYIIYAYEKGKQIVDFKEGIYYKQYAPFYFTKLSSLKKFNEFIDTYCQPIFTSKKFFLNKNITVIIFKIN